MKSRATKRREAWQLIAWVGGMVAGLFILYCLTEGVPTAGIGIITPLITVAGTLSGVFLGSQLSQRQRHEEENRRRRAHATMLLHELQFLMRVLTDIRNSQAPGGEKEIALSQTAVYNQAGVNLALFTSETIHTLMSFYRQVQALQERLTQLTEQARITSQPISSRSGVQDELREQATHATNAITGLVNLLPVNH